MRQSPSRRQASPTVSRSSYFQKGSSSPTQPQRTTSPSAGSSSASQHIKGTYAFLPNGKNDDRGQYIRAHAQKIHDLYYDLPGIASGRAKTPDLSKSTQRGERCDFQKQIHMGTGLYYDLPGMAEAKSTKAPDLSKSSYSGDRAAYLKAMHFPKSEYIPLPGMADEIQKDTRGSLAFRLATSASRDSHIKASHKPTGLVYNVPGMADELKRDAMKGTAAFRMSSPRRSTPESRSAGKTGARFSVDAYNLPGMADEIKKSSSGTFAFRTTSPRGDYIRQFQKTNDLHYDIPGMSGVVYSPLRRRDQQQQPLNSSPCSATSPRPQSPSRQQQLINSPQYHSTAAAGGVSRGNGGSAAAIPAARRFDSPTRASIARQEAVTRDRQEREGTT